VASSVCRSIEIFGNRTPLQYNPKRNQGAIMRHAIIAVLASVFFAVSPAWAQTSPAPSPPAENIAAARELIQVTRATDQFKALLPIILQSLKPAFVQGRPEMEKDFDAILPAINQVAARRVDELAEALAVIYASNFSVAEIHDIAAFYRSSTGQKFLEQQPVIARESMVAGQQWARTLSSELREAISEELRKREHAN
jgi:uncharacterized protein